MVLLPMLPPLLELSLVLPLRVLEFVLAALAVPPRTCFLFLPPARKPHGGFVKSNPRSPLLAC
jgi:hypothetical protein